MLYLELKPETISSDFKPGRAFRPSCLDGSVHITASDDTPEYCIMNIGDAANDPTLVNATEFVKTAANSSKINQVYLSDGFAVLGPTNPPIDFDFQADTFGSRTSCRAVTGLCGANNTRGERTPYDSDYNFVCNASVAGLNMTGNFWNVLTPQDPNTGASTGPDVTDGSDGKKTKGVLPASLVLGGDTITRQSSTGQTYPIGLQYFNDSQKLRQWKSGLNYGLDFDDPDDSSLHWAMVWRAYFDSPIGSYDEKQSDNPSNVSAVGVSNVQAGGTQGILSCDTSIYELVSGQFLLSASWSMKVDFVARHMPLSRTR